MTAIPPAGRIIYALDVPDLAAARAQVALLAGHVGVFKVGLELFVREGPGVVRMVHDAGCAVFLDLKLHDIPATTTAAIRSAAALGTRFLTVHAEALAGMPVKMGEIAPGLAVLAVTALTSLDRAALSAMGYKAALCDPARLVLKRARMAFEAGCAGVVCSAHEARRVRAEYGPGFIIVTPGIRPADVSTDDQARVATPAQAVLDGADYLVIGRPIRNAPDPVAAAAAIAAGIAAALG
ncbi:MAG: orotidine-5'-phosphate decarboxylase [Nitrospirae bacterium]|nr:orotidine-5'-phosphate decarboxylase [Nitrospirota bacterium]